MYSAGYRTRRFKRQLRKDWTAISLKNYSAQLREIVLQDYKFRKL